MDQEDRITALADLAADMRATVRRYQHTDGAERLDELTERHARDAARIAGGRYCPPEHRQTAGETQP